MEIWAYVMWIILLLSCFAKFANIALDFILPAESVDKGVIPDFIAEMGLAIWGAFVLF